MKEETRQLLIWTKDYDEMDNLIWSTPSPWTDEDGCPEFYFRIQQRLRDNKHEFYEASDADVMMDEEEPRTWTSLCAAQDAMEQDYRDIVEAIRERNPQGGPS